MSPFKTILYPTDFSELSQPAFSLACELAEHYRAALVVLHVKPLPIVASYEGVIIPEVPQAETHLWDKLRGIQPKSPAVAVDHRLAEGDAAEEIVRKAREVPCDLIVMSTHGRTGLKRLVLGSVAEQVVRKAPCPVLTVKPPFLAEKEAPPRQESEPVTGASTPASPSRRH